MKTPTDNKSVYNKTVAKHGFLQYYVHRTIPAKASDTTIILDGKYEHAPDLLAYDIYGDAKLWWAIPQRNSLEDPIFDLKAGMSLVLPSKNTVNEVL